MSDNPLAGIPCRDCAEPALVIEWRDILVARPPGTWSLAGAQPKTSAYKTAWPWCVCRACGAESKAKVSNE